MDANSIAEMGSFGQEHFGHCDLGDKRLTQRLVLTADRFLQHPDGTLPQKLNDNAELIGFYRLANNPKVTYQKLMDAHCAHTRQMMDRLRGTVLVIHDTTEIDLSGLKSVQDLGPIGHGGNGACRGYLCHNSLVYDYDSAEVLGLASQVLHVRRKVPRNESPKAKREHPQRESRLWKKGWSKLGPAPQGQQRVNMGDRGADLLEFMDAMQQAGDSYVLRSKSNRNILIDDGQGGVTQAKLHNYARQLPWLGTRQVQVQDNGKTCRRQATVRVAAGAVTIKAPHFCRGEHSKQDLKAWVVHVLEINPPEGQKALEWILLTNVAVEDFASACQRVDWYACRPIIEEYHKAQKTGCGIELPQFTTGQALQVAIGLLSVVATQLLRLRDLSRRADAAVRPASEVVDREHVRVLSLWRFKAVRDLSVQEFCTALAKLGGHLNRRCDRPPGWLILWRGWIKLQLMVEGVRVSRPKTCV